MSELIAFSSSHPWLVAMAVGLTALAITNEWRMRGLAALSLSPSEAVQFINHGALVVDLRPAEQFTAGHIVSAQTHSPETLLAEATNKKNDIDRLLVCDERGAHSPHITKLLRAQGVDKAFCLQGGIANWQQAQLPLTKTKTD